MDVMRLRQEIPATQRVIYLNTAWSGPRVALACVKEWLDFENYEGSTSPHVLQRRRQLQEDARRAVARLLGGSAGSLALTQNTTVLERLEEAISPRARLILLSHITYSNGLCPPLKEIQAMARERHIPVLVDAAQSVGQMALVPSTSAGSLSHKSSHPRWDTTPLPVTTSRGAGHPMPSPSRSSS
jgi:selenocysteine lyase/cysteine desulfurase